MRISDLSSDVCSSDLLSLEAQHLARARTLWDAQHHGAVHGRHLHLAAEHRLVQRDGKIEPDVVAVAPEEAVRLDRNGDNRVAIGAGAGLSLTREADLGAFLDPLWELDVDRLAASQRHPLVGQRRRILEGYGQAIEGSEET